MKRLWTIASYPTAAVGGYFIAQATEEAAQNILGLAPLTNTVVILAISGLIFGFMVDEIIPTYIHDVTEGGSGDDIGGGMDGGDMDGDFDFE